MNRARLKPLAGALVLAVGAGACIGGKSPGDTTALVVGRIIGAVQARNGTQLTWYPLKVGMHVPSGATVQVPPRGDVQLKRGTLSTVEMRPYQTLVGELKVVDAGNVVVFVGDVLFAGSVGRTDLPGGSTEQLMDSIMNQLLPLGDEVEVYSGHGPVTTIGHERRTNPFLTGAYPIGRGSRF